MNNKPKDVDTYIATAPKEIQGKLKVLRTTIRQVVPTAIERISYGMPYYDYKGRLVYFAFAKSHIGLYIPPPVIEECKSKLKNYETATSTIRFTIYIPLPIALIKTLLKPKMKKNEEKSR